MTTRQYSMNGWSQVFTGVEFNCNPTVPTTATQGVHHVLHLI